MAKTNQAVVDAIEPKPTNPHCEQPWPQGSYSSPLAAMTNASLGATALVRLLETDDNIRCPDMNTDGVPFDNYIRGGLWAALNTCLDVLETRLELMRDREDGDV